MPTPPEDPKPGDIFSARWLSSVTAFLRSRRLVSDGSILIREAPGWCELRANLPQEMDVKITGGTNPYSGIEQRPVSGGGWANLAGGRVFTLAGDPLWERNRNTGVAIGTFVHAKRNRSGAAIFDRGACTTTTTTTTTPTTNPTPAPAPGPAPAPAPTPGPIPPDTKPPENSPGYPSPTYPAPPSLPPPTDPPDTTAPGIPDPTNTRPPELPFPGDGSPTPPIGWPPSIPWPGYPTAGASNPAADPAPNPAPAPKPPLTAGAGGSGGYSPTHPDPPPP